MPNLGCLLHGRVPGAVVIGVEPLALRAKVRLHYVQRRVGAKDNLPPIVGELLRVVGRPLGIPLRRLPMILRIPQRSPVGAIRRSRGPGTRCQGRGPGARAASLGRLARIPPACALLLREERSNPQRRARGRQHKSLGDHCCEHRIDAREPTEYTSANGGWWDGVQLAHDYNAPCGAKLTIDNGHSSSHRIRVHGGIGAPRANPVHRLAPVPPDRYKNGTVNPSAARDARLTSAQWLGTCRSGLL